MDFLAFFSLCYQNTINSIPYLANNVYQKHQLFGTMSGT